jgi:hypothetical protein
VKFFKEGGESRWLNILRSEGDGGSNLPSTFHILFIHNITPRLQHIDVRAKRILLHGGCWTLTSVESGLLFRDKYSSGI